MNASLWKIKSKYVTRKLTEKMFNESLMFFSEYKKFDNEPSLPSYSPHHETVPHPSGQHGVSMPYQPPVYPNQVNINFLNNNFLVGDL